MMRRFSLLALALVVAACSSGPEVVVPATDSAPPILDDAPTSDSPPADPAPSPEASDDDAIYPFDYQVRDFDNGLRAVVVPTGLPDIVSVQIVMGTGSRDEIEPGRSGFAHFFEHMMFRGTETMSADAYQTALKRMGGDQNAYTSNDRTVYHTTLLTEDLDEMLAMEADRFQNLQYSEADFRTEALAVLGEYNKNFSSPIQKLLEAQRKAAFDDHTYRHTTMGFIEDIEAMPEGYDYSLDFYERHYRPENAVVLIAGDVAPEATFEMIERHFGSWTPGYTAPEIPTEGSMEGPLYEHVAWDGPTPPWVTVAFRGPGAYPTAANAASGDMQALDVIASLGFGASSPLYQRLVVEEQVADVISPYFPDSRDPFLLTILARVTDPAHAAYVRDEIQKELARLSVQPPDAQKLADLKNSLTYGFAAGLDNTEAIADAIVPVLSVSRDPETLNDIYRTYAAITPEAVREVA
ncbi:MAG: pitrilysin family protein, partial [Bacteroidota bacterium]